jgi:type II secretory ATPase GspE/PulE/Tfp pilus assembly ATPase PilB-like protein
VSIKWPTTHAQVLKFSTIIKALLRQDPDVIMIGEIRDSATANLAIQAAQTGHLVLSTLHTRDARSVLTKIA